MPNGRGRPRTGNAGTRARVYNARTGTWGPRVDRRSSRANGPVQRRSGRPLGSVRNSVGRKRRSGSQALAQPQPREYTSLERASVQERAAVQTRIDSARNANRSSRSVKRRRRLSNSKPRKV